MIEYSIRAAKYSLLDKHCRFFYPCLFYPFCRVLNFSILFRYWIDAYLLAQLYFDEFLQVTQQQKRYALFQTIAKKINTSEFFVLFTVVLFNVRENKTKKKHAKSRGKQKQHRKKNNFGVCKFRSDGTVPKITLNCRSFC